MKINIDDLFMMIISIDVGLNHLKMPPTTIPLNSQMKPKQNLNLKQKLNFALKSQKYTHETNTNTNTHTGITYTRMGLDWTSPKQKDTNHH